MKRDEQNMMAEITTFKKSTKSKNKLERQAQVLHTKNNLNHSKTKKSSESINQPEEAVQEL